ncbi:MAG: carboxypeptidase M32 [Parachlamydiales bacterium]|jgi:carboxypeptidase Taq
MDSKEDYQNLVKASQNKYVLRGVEALLHWDQETYMPPQGAEFRAEQHKTIASLVHNASTSTELKSAIEALISIETGEVKATNLPVDQQAALIRWRRDYKKSVALPGWFVEELAKLTSHSLEAWKEARKEKNFNKFAPYLETLVEMAQRQAEFLGFKDNPYDALIDQFEPGATTASTTELFDSIKQPLVELLKNITERPQLNTKFLENPVSEDKQLKMGKTILEEMGYNFSKGNLSKTTHPFCQYIGANDCRVTTRIQINDFMSNLKVVLHEGGHALYALQLPVDKAGTPLGEAISMAVHESQSRWWECCIGLSKPFWKYYLPVLQKEYSPQLDGIQLEDFWKAVNKVKPSFIRVEADELTYPLHIILRFEIEQALINNQLKVKDVPEVWNSKMKELLGITPPDDSMGCLQDVHWAFCGFGYFPTYLMGNAYAAYMLEAFTAQTPDWEARLAGGQLAFINEWMAKNVHQYGRQFDGPELLENIGKKPFTADPYIQYLTAKYTEVYA